MKSIVVLGAGIAGCGAAHRLRVQGVSSTLYEKNSYAGGHTYTYQEAGGWVFDEGPHISFTKNEEIRQLLADNVDNRYVTGQVRLNNHWKGHWIKHPAQVHLHGLPTDLIVECIKDFVDAQKIGDGPVANYQEWLYRAYGKTFAETFPMEYGLKYHTTPASNMSTDWLGPRFYRPTLEEVLKGAFSSDSQAVHYVTDFRYPTREGFLAYLKKFFDASTIKLDHKVTELDPKRKQVRFSNGTVVPYEGVVSSIPLPDLIPLIVGAPTDVLEAAQRLACTTVVIVTVGVNRTDISDTHWTYFYDRDYIFSRVSLPHLQSPHNAPPGCASIQAECYFSKKYKPLDKEPKAYVKTVVADLRRCGFIRPDDKILMEHVMVVPYANIIFDLERAAALKTVHGYLDDLGIGYCGRYGDWGYLWTDESLISGERAAQKVLDGKK